MSRTTEPEARPTARLCTILRTLVDVRPGELLALSASMLWIFLVLTAYYVIKPLRSAVLQERIGVDNKWIALGLTTLFVGLFAYGYGKVVTRVPRGRLVLGTFVFFVSCLGAFALALPRGGSFVGYAFFVWVSTFNLMVVSQFWSLAADIWTKEEGLRLFGAIGIGGVAGGIFGTLVVAGLARKMSTEGMLGIAAALLCSCMALASFLLRFAETRSRSHAPAAAFGPRPSSSGPAPNSLLLVLRSPYLRRIALMMLLLNLVNTSNEWLLDKMVSRAHLEGGELKGFYARFYLLQNTFTFVIQFFLTARIQQRFGASLALLFEPVIGIVGGLLFAIRPALSLIRWHKIIENATDYSIQSNTKELLYLPVGLVEKYSAKSFNDTFVVRGGDALGAGLIYLATSPCIQTLGEIGLRALMLFNVALGILWVVVALGIGRMHREQMAQLPARGSTVAD